MTIRQFAFQTVVPFLFASCGLATPIEGMVKNLTTNRASDGDEVVLLSLSTEMREVARTRTDKDGRFVLQVPDDATPKLIRIMHQGASYFSAVDVTKRKVTLGVYDVVSSQLPGVTTSLNVQRYEGQATVLDATEIFVINNASSPPKTLLGERTFEIFLPADAEIVAVGIKSGNGKPTSVKGRSGDAPGHYYFDFAIRPGETRLQVRYRLEYSGERKIVNTRAKDIALLVVGVPKTMHFESLTKHVFTDSKTEGETTLQFAESLKSGQEIAYRVSGNGAWATSKVAKSKEQPTAQNASLPGGGLGPPVTSPDPLRSYRWQILGGLAVMMFVGAVLASRRKAPIAPGSQVFGDPQPVSVSSRRRSTGSTGNARRSVCTATGPRERST